MSSKSTMIDLEVRKRLLVMQADLHRALLRTEAAGLREQWSWLGEASQKARSVSPWISLGAAALGLLAAWRGRRLARWIPAVLAAWNWFQRVRAPRSQGD
jgi:hypothetical protein